MKSSCCFPLSFCAKLLSIFDFGIAALGLIFCSGGLLYLQLFPDGVDQFLKEHQNNLEPFVRVEKGSLLPILIIGIIYYVGKLGLGSLFILGVFLERIKFIRIWVLCTLALLVASVMGYLSFIMVGLSEPLISIPLYVVSFIGREYVIWVGYCYLKRLQEENTNSFLIREIGGDDKFVYTL